MLENRTQELALDILQVVVQVPATKDKAKPDAVVMVALAAAAMEPAITLMETTPCIGMAKKVNLILAVAAEVVVHPLR